MPQVSRVTGQSVSTQVQSGPTASRVDSAAFGGQVAESIGRVGQQVQQVADTLAITSAEEAAVQFERDKNNIFFNPENGYFNKQGKDAYENAELTTTELNKLKQKYMDSLNSPLAKNAFGKVADSQITSSQRDIMAHASSGLKAWEISTLNSQVENTVENASLYWADSERLGVQKALGRQSIIDAADMEGVGEITKNERLQNFESSFAAANVQAAINNSSAIGEQYLEKNRKSLEPQDVARLEGMIATKKAAEQTAADNAYAVTEASRYVNTYEKRADAIKEIDQIEDTELRKKVMKETTYRYDQREKAKEESRAQSFNNGEQFIYNGGTAQQWATNNPDAWNELTVDQKQQLESGKAVQTDWVTFNNFMALPDDEKAKIKPNEIATQLGIKEREVVASEIRRAQKGDIPDQLGRTTSQQATQAVEVLMNKKSSKWGNSDKKTANEFYRIINSEVAAREKVKGSQLNSSEYTKLLDDFTKEVIVKGGGAFGWFDKGYDVPGDFDRDEFITYADVLQGTGNEVSVDAVLKSRESIDAAIDWLEENDREPTTENIIKVLKLGMRQ